MDVTARDVAELPVGAQVSCPCVTETEGGRGQTEAELILGHTWLCLHHATREGPVTPLAEFTRMIQQQLINPPPSPIYTPRLPDSPTAPRLRPSCSTWRQRAVEIAPLEPVTLFNDTSGQNVTALLQKNAGGGMP